MTIYEKLLNIQIELKAPKNQYNSFGKYNYRNCEDILESVKPLCKKYKVCLVLTDKIINAGDRNYIESTATITDIESLEKISNSASAMKAGIKYISKFRKTYDNKEISDDKELSEAVKRLDALQSRFEEGKIYTYKLQASCCQVVIVKKYFKYCKVRIKHVDYDNADNYYTLLQKQARSFSVGYELLSDCYGK